MGWLEFGPVSWLVSPREKGSLLRYCAGVVYSSRIVHHSSQGSTLGSVLLSDLRSLEGDQVTYRNW